MPGHAVASVYHPGPPSRSQTRCSRLVGSSGCLFTTAYRQMAPTPSRGATTLHPRACAANSQNIGVRHAPGPFRDRYHGIAPYLVHRHLDFYISGLRQRLLMCPRHLSGLRAFPPSSGAASVGMEIISRVDMVEPHAVGRF